MASHRSHEHLPGAYIRAVAYAGADVIAAGEAVYQRDAQDTADPLDQQIREACAFVRKKMKMAAMKRANGGRVDLPKYDMTAVFEAVVNAVAHRDYSMAGAKVRLRLFADRLELSPPGMLGNTMTQESLPYRQVPRNEALTSLLARCPVDIDELAGHRSHIMDKRGEGVPIILARSEQLSGRRPQYRMIDKSELALTIYAASAEAEERQP